jgi:Domain of unknown function (DUF4384)
MEIGRTGLNGIPGRLTPSIERWEKRMVDGTHNPMIELVRIARGQERRGLFSAWYPEADQLVFDQNWIAIRVNRSHDGMKTELTQQPKVLLRNKTVEIHFVNPDHWRMSFHLPSLFRDTDQHKWDTHLDMQCRFENASLFVAKCTSAIGNQDGIIDSGLIHAFLLHRIDFKLRDLVVNYSARQMVSENVMPAQAWEGRLNDFLGEYGIRCSVTDVKYASMSAELEEQQKLELEFVQRRQRAEAEIKANEVEQEKIKAGIERRRQEIETDRLLTATRREKELADIDQEKLKQASMFLQQQAEWQLQMEQTAIERAELGVKRQELELKLAQLRKSMAESELAEQRLEREKADLQERKSRLQESVQKVHEEGIKRDEMITESAQQIGRLSLDLNSSNLMQAHQAREKLTSPEIGLSTELLAEAGFGDARQQMLEFFRNREKSARGQLRFFKRDLITRDMGTPKQHQILRLNSPLDFQLSSDAEGYLTLFNVGTSGRCWLIAPNFMCPSVDCRMKAGVDYQIPGRPIFPFVLQENGPAGWEHIIAIVSDIPLVRETICRKSDKASPVAEVILEDIADWRDMLLAETDPWVVAVLSFKVEI